MSSARFALLFTLLLPARPLQADVIAVEAIRSPFCLVGESVRISAGKDLAIVEGDYDYKYVRRYDTAGLTERIPFHYAVMAPKTAESADELIAVTQAKLHLGSLDFEPEDFILPGESLEASTKVPSDARPVILVFRVPRRLLHQQCRVHISHYQTYDHYAGKTVMTYLPFLPDFEILKNELLFSRDDFAVSFEVVDAVQLHRLSANQFVQKETPQLLTLHPVHLENIVLEVAGAPGK